MGVLGCWFFIRDEVFEFLSGVSIRSAWWLSFYVRFPIFRACGYFRSMCVFLYSERVGFSVLLGRVPLPFARLLAHAGEGVRPAVAVLPSALFCGASGVSVCWPCVLFLLFL